MWVPYRLYEALPKVFLAVGAMVLAGAVYLAFEYRSVSIYLFIGLACIAYGAFILWLRRRYRRPRPAFGAEGDNTIVAMARRFH